MGRAAPSEGHGPEGALGALPVDSVLPSSMRLLEHPMSPPPRYAAGLETGTTTLASAKVAYVPGPREGIRPTGSQGAWVAS